MEGKFKKESRRTLVTAGLPYANGPIHLGHLVEYIQADIFARFLKLKGEDAAYICGDDTHGTPIEINAAKEGIKPEQHIEKYYEEHAKDFSDFLIEFDSYYTTNSPENRNYSDLFFNTLKEKGHITQRVVELTYCEKCSRYLPDRYVKGKCPKCNAEDQYGDVCEKCNSAYKTTDLIEPYCTICRSTPARKSSLHYFFRLSGFSEKLEKWLKSNEGLQEEAKNFVLNWIEKGLEDWDITRDGPYFGFLIPGETSKYYYVWLDAPIGYIASTEKYCKERFKGKESKDALYYWKSPDSRIIHFIGKDIFYFHFLFWPAMLMGVGYNLPDTIKVHGFLTVNGEKMSKSRGTFITARAYLEQQDPEFLRFYYTANAPSSMDDTNLDFEDFKNRINSDLVDNIANYAYRVLSFANNNLDSKIGKISGRSEKQLINELETKFEEALSHYEKFEFREAVRKILEISAIGNKHFQDSQPWQLIRTDRKKCEEAVAMAANIVKNLSILLAPILPKYADRLQKQLGIEKQTFKNLDFRLQSHRINKARIIFTKIEGEAFSIKQFPLKLRVAKIISAEDHPNADKLYVLRIDLGSEQRQLVAGLKGHYSKEELIGKNIIVVTNLKHAVLRGVKSEGMLLAADDGNKVAVLEAKSAKPGDAVSVEGYAASDGEIGFEDFTKIKMATKNGKAVYKDTPRTTGKGEITADIGDGARIR
ncbi:methionine--tRNA ligase [Candidatus Woesearchaeota archaeon]|nr:methionine--tRNA ligase [Candidatus Woesearchaeota archaeon]